VSPWVEPGSVFNDEYRHTSLIATLRKAWDLGPPFTGRDASARTFDHVFTRDIPGQPETWVPLAAQPVPDWTTDPEVVGRAISNLGTHIATGLIAFAKARRAPLPPQVADPATELTPALLAEVIRDVSRHFFPQLANGEGPSH
jgi:phospholipase C